MSYFKNTKRMYKSKPRYLNKKPIIKLIDQRINKNSELKHYDAEVNDQPVNSTGITVQLTAVPQGDGDNQRIGDSFQVNDLIFRLRMQVLDPYNVFRFMVLQWHPNDIVDTCEVVKVLQSASVYSNLNWHRRNDYRILYDKLLRGDADDPIVVRTIKIKQKLRKVLFNEGTNFGHNQLYILMISDSGAISHPVITYHRRLTYYDR